MSVPAAVIAPQLAASADSEPGERGRLQIGEVVVRKLVEHAADAVPGVLRGSRRVAGVTLGHTSTSATVAVGMDTVDVALELVVCYPNPIAAVVADVREYVTSEVARITGHSMRSFEVTVTQLRREHTGRVV